RRSKSPKPGGEPALGVHLQIEQRAGHGGTTPEREQHHEKASAVGSKQSPNDPPEHGFVCRARAWHHSPRRIGAGSYCEARRSGSALPRKVTPAASAITTRKTIKDDSGAAPKIFCPRRRARTIPSE